MASSRRYGLNDPVHIQYWHWLAGRKDAETGQYVGGILRGEFGYSRTGNQTVIALIQRRFPATVELALYAIIPIIGVGIWLGILAAVNHNKLIDQITRVFAIVGYSFPTFVFGLLALMFLYVQLGWFPPGRLSDWANAAVSTPAYNNYTSIGNCRCYPQWSF